MHLIPGADRLALEFPAKSDANGGDDEAEAVTDENKDKFVEASLGPQTDPDPDPGPNRRKVCESCW